MNRRTFIGSSVAATLAAKLPGPPLFQASLAYRVQLYTVRDAMKSDFEGTIAKVASIGYKEVEFAGYFDHSPKTFAPSSTKTASPRLLPRSLLHCRNDVAPGSRRRSHIGHKLIVNPWIEPKQRDSADGWKRAAELFNKAAKRQESRHPVRLHNHTFEFQPAKSLDGKLPYDYLLATCDKNFVKMELDLCWISVAGKDPISYFNNNPAASLPFTSRTSSSFPVPKTHHCRPDKQMGFLTEVAAHHSWKDIFANAGKAGIQHYSSSTTIHPKLRQHQKSFDFLHSLNY